MESIDAYQLLVLLCFESKQNSETGLMYFVPNLLYNVNLV
jgi:hypothetical protein